MATKKFSKFPPKKPDTSHIIKHNPKRDWSDYQKAIFRDIAQATDHTVVIARAGSGIAGSVGNGTAMRAAPFGVYYRNDIETLVKVCKIDSAITHASDDAEAGSIAIALATAYAINGGEVDFLEKIWEFLPDSKVKSTIYSLGSLLNSEHITPQQALRVLGTKADVRETVPAALYCFLKFDNYYDAVLTAIKAGGDTDTTAAIVGAMCGARYGMKAIDKAFHSVEDFDKLVQLDSQLYNRSSQSFFPRS